MSLIARDNSVYALLDQPMTFGAHRGVTVGLVVEEFPDYIRWLLDRDAITLAGEVEEAYRLQLIKLEGRERDGGIYDPYSDPFGDQWDRDGDDSLADFTI